MVSQVNLTVLAINIIICICPTIIFLIYALIKSRSLFRPFFVGGITFFVSQVIIRSPINTLMFSDYPNKYDINWSYIIFIVLTAIILEEGGKFLGLKFFLKEHTKRIDGISFGIGFASGYNILFSLISHISKFSLALNANDPDFMSFINISKMDMENINIIHMLSQTSWNNLLLSSFHNIAFLLIEIGLTLILMHGILNGLKHSIIAIIITSCSHIFTEGLGLFFTEMLKINEYTVELYIIFIAILSLIFIFASKRLKSFK